jgi:hypothetical protein
MRKAEAVSCRSLRTRFSTLEHAVELVSIAFGSGGARARAQFEVGAGRYAWLAESRSSFTRTRGYQIALGFATH